MKVINFVVQPGPAMHWRTTRPGTSHYPTPMCMLHTTTSLLISQKHAVRYRACGQTERQIDRPTETVVRDESYVAKQYVESLSRD